MRDEKSRICLEVSEEVLEGCPGCLGAFECVEAMLLDLYNMLLSSYCMRKSPVVHMKQSQTDRRTGSDFVNKCSLRI